jgi:hypothetical protein
MAILPISMKRKLKSNIYNMANQATYPRVNPENCSFSVL